MKKKICDLTDQEAEDCCAEQEEDCMVIYPNFPEEEAFRYENANCPLHGGKSSGCPVQRRGFLYFFHKCFNSVEEATAYLNTEVEVPDKKSSH